MKSLKRVPFLRPASDIVRHHHERFDGSGYPDGLKGTDIPLGARAFFAVADTLDASYDERPHLSQKAAGMRQQGAEIECCSGKINLTLRS